MADIALKKSSYFFKSANTSVVLIFGLVSLIVSGEYCPIDFKWDFTYLKCIECSRGSFGRQCAYNCSYPSFGRRCLEGVCNCSTILCDPANGCKDEIILPSGISSHQYSQKISTQPMAIIDKDDQWQIKRNDFGVKNISRTVKYHDRGLGSSIIIRKQGDYTVIVLITVAGTSISVLLLVAIGFQLS